MNITYMLVSSLPVVILYFILLPFIYKTMHALGLKGDIPLPRNVTTLSSLKGRCLNHLHQVKSLKPSYI